MLVAHHRQDQAETVLLRLLRGSGPRGLGAMPVERPLGQAQLLRPLLDVNREDLEAYVRAQGVGWVEDESNTDSRFDRNFLRRDVLPLIQQRWPEAANALSISATLCRDSDALLAEMAREDLLRLNVRQESLSSWRGYLPSAWPGGRICCVIGCAIGSYLCPIAPSYRNLNSSFLVRLNLNTGTK